MALFCSVSYCQFASHISVKRDFKTSKYVTTYSFRNVFLTPLEIFFKRYVLPALLFLSIKLQIVCFYQKQESYFVNLLFSEKICTLVSTVLLFKMDLQEFSGYWDKLLQALKSPELSCCCAMYLAVQERGCYSAFCRKWKIYVKVEMYGMLW